MCGNPLLKFSRRGRRGFKFARKFNIKLAAILPPSSSIGRVLWRHCRGAMCRVNLRLRGDEILRTEAHCAAVFCAAGCELRVRRSAPLKTYRKRAKFNRGGVAKF
jgi:hypothetical protein